MSLTPSEKRAYPGKGKGKAQDAPHKEPSTSTPQAQSKHLESWFDKFTHRQSAKDQEKENKETESWLRTREVSSIYFVPYKYPVVFNPVLAGWRLQPRDSAFLLSFV